MHLNPSDKPTKRLIPWNEHGMRPYIRVSTKKQENRSQTDRLQKFYQKNLWEWPPDEYIYTEKASAFKAGGLKFRAAFQRLLAEIRAGDAKGFVVTRWSRYFRNTRMALTVYEELYALGAQAYAAERPYNPFTPDNRARFLREIAEAEAYSLELSSRVRDGKDAQSARGLVFGGPPPFGVIKWVRGRPKWNKDEALIVRRAINTYLEGTHSLMSLAAELSTDERQFTDVTIWTWLTNPLYYGLVRIMPPPNGPTDTLRRRDRRAKLRPADFKGLVLRRKYAQVKALMAERSVGGRGAHATGREYAFGSSACTCSVCGKSLIAMYNTYKDGKTSVYRCGSWHQPDACEARSKFIPESDLIAQFGIILKSFGVLTPDYIARAKEVAKGIVTTNATKPARTISKLELNRQRDSLGLQLARRRITMDEFNDALAKLDELEFSEPVVNQKRHAQAATAQRLDEMGAAAADIFAVWDAATLRQKRLLVRDFTTDITVDITTRRITSIAVTPVMAAVFMASPNPLPALAPLTFQTAHLFAPRLGRRNERVWQAFELGQPETQASLVAKTGLTTSAVAYALQRGCKSGILSYTTKAREGGGGAPIRVYSLVRKID